MAPEALNDKINNEKTDVVGVLVCTHMHKLKLWLDRKVRCVSKIVCGERIPLLKACNISHTMWGMTTAR